MRLLVAPVSGGMFPNQLAMYNMLPSIPDIILASSGGNIASYIALAADYNIHGMERILRCLNSSLLLKSWWPGILSFLPSIIAGFTRGSIYDSGIGFEPLFQTMFTPYTISRKEIWTGTTNCNTSKCQLFCNLSEHESTLKLKNFTYDEFNIMPLRYLNRNISDISAITLASASIPSFVPPVTFNGAKYADGGATYASPLTPMVPTLRYHHKLHIDYLSSFDVISTKPLIMKDMKDIIKSTTQGMIHSMILQDRSNGVELIRNGSGELNFIESFCTANCLKQLYKFRNTTTRSLLELYPINDNMIEMDNYVFEDANRILHLNEKHFRFRFWWLGDRDISDFKIWKHLSEDGCSVSSM